MKWWTRLLPLAFVAWFARRNCEVFVIQGESYVRPFNDVLIRKDAP